MISLTALALVLTAEIPAAQAGNYNIYVQGRGWKTWSGEVVSSAGWTNVILSFNGNARLNTNETNVTVKNAIATYCSGGNYCYIHAYSAGCLRVLKAIDDLRASGNSLPGLIWSEGIACASGGTKLAEVSTKGFTGFLAKLLGQQEAIDYDLTPSAARSTWGYVQDAMSPSAMYHMAGKNNVCKKILFIKICGNKYVDGGVGDGVVPLHSASGASTAVQMWDGCAAAKYPGRYWEPGRPCGGEDRDHFGMPGRAMAVTGPQIANGTGVDWNMSWNDVTSDPDCDDVQGQCDSPFSSGAQDWSKKPTLQAVAGDVSAYSSNTTGSTAGATCAGKCGKYSGAGCWCDSACTSFGDCCGDYAPMCSAYQY